MFDAKGREFDQRASEKLAAYLKENNITSANFAEVKNFKSSFVYLAPVLRDNTTLTKINFDKNEFEDTQASLLIDILRNNQTLTDLTVNLSKVSSKKLEEFASHLRNNFTLESISLGDFSPSFKLYYAKDEDLKDGVIEFTKIAKRNKLLNQAIKENAAKLDLSDIDLSGSVFDTIIAKLHSASVITEIVFNNCKITYKEFTSLAEYVLHNADLTTLKLAENELTDESVPLIGKIIETHPSLSKVKLVINCFSKTGKEKITDLIAENIHLIKFELEEWHAYYPKSYPKSEFQEIIDGYITRNKNLIELAKNITFATSIKLESLYLNLRCCQKLVKLLQKNSHIFDLNLKGCTIPSEGFDYFIEYFKKGCNLEQIDFSETKLNDSALASLAKALMDNSTVTKLSLRQNRITNEGIKALAEVLKSKKSALAVLDLSNDENPHGEHRAANTISQEGVVYLANALTANQTLFKLLLDRNPIPAGALITLAKALQSNRVLTYLSLDNTQLDDQGVAQFIVTLDPLQNKALKPKQKKTAPINNSLYYVNFSRTTYKEKKNKHGRIESYIPIEQKFDKVPDPNAKSASAKISLETFINRNLLAARDLISAVETGNLTKVNELIKQSSMYVTKEDDGSNLLHIAVQYGHISIVQSLLALGFNRRLRNKKLVSPLDLAKETKNQALIDLLINTPQVNIYELDKQITSPIVFTPSITQKRKQDLGTASSINPLPKQSPDEEIKHLAKKNKTDSADLALVPPLNTSPMPQAPLIDPTDLSINAPTLHTVVNELALFDAVANGQVFQLAAMINDKTLNCTDKEGNTCLHIAVLYGQTKSAEILLKYKLDVNAANAKGLTPLYLLVEQIVKYSRNEQALLNQYQLARLLIQANANVNIKVKDVTLGGNKIAVLHKAVALEQYALMKIILCSRFVDINLMDDQNWSALNWAIDRRNTKILSRLLIDRRWQDSSIQNAIQHIKFLQSDSLGQSDNTLLEMLTLLEQRENVKLPKPESGIQWINKFSITLGSYKPQKRITINSNKEHAYLAMQNEFTRKRIFELQSMDEGEENKDFPGNPVTASITFIISADTYRSGQVIKRKKLTINLNFTDKFHISGAESDTTETTEEEKERIKRRATLAPTDIFDQPKDIYKPLTPEEIEEKFQAELDNQDPSFKQLFHHGEQSLLDYLEQPETIKQIVLQLKQNPKFVYGCKIYGLILNIYSPRYLCENCEPAILGEQHADQSPFLMQLKTELEMIGCVLAKFSPLRMITQVSSHIAFHKEVVTADEHEALHVDLRSCDNTLILAQDISAFDPDNTQFHSSKFK